MVHLPKLGDIGLALEKVGERLGIPNLDPSSGKIFITGGTGVIGHRVALRLLKAGYTEVRVGVHEQDKAEDLKNLGAEVVTFNWENEDTYDEALKGARSVLFTAPYVKHWEEKFDPFLKACDRANVKHMVKLSFYHARVKGDVFANVPLVQAHARTDRHLANWGSISYTLISPTHFMSNVLVYQGDSLRKDETPVVFYGASDGKKINYVSPNDVAEMAMHALLAPTRKDHLYKEHTITGPEAITDDTVAAVLSKNLDKPVMYVDQPLHTFEECDKKRGDPTWKVRDMVALEHIKATGKEEVISLTNTDFEKICGHKAETFEDYLKKKEFMSPMELV